MRPRLKKSIGLFFILALAVLCTAARTAQEEGEQTPDLPFFACETVGYQNIEQDPAYQQVVSEVNAAYDVKARFYNIPADMTVEAFRTELTKMAVQQQTLKNRRHFSAAAQETDAAANTAAIRRLLEGLRDATERAGVKI